MSSPSPFSSPSPAPLPPAASTALPSDAAFRAMASALTEALFVVDEWWRLQWANRAGEQLLTAAGLKRDGGEFLGLLATDTRERVVLDGAVGEWHGEGELVGSDLSAVSIVIYPIEAGVPPGWRAVRLCDLAPRRALETSLTEARHMERVGRLALALSHEFSELLTAIAGSAELVASELAPRDALRGDVETIRHSADRAAVLTRELARSAASRTAAPQRVPLSQAVGAMDVRLRHTLGDRVQLVLDLASDAGEAHLDLSQLEAALLHLARNARDAMPYGGQWYVTVRPVECAVPRKAVHAVMRPGRYALVELRDTGCGMNEATLARCFEPLFSTRGREGLGLSLVYGAVTQMGGYITADSAPGLGTIVALHLPLMPHATAHRNSAPAYTRSILVVDDEEPVRQIVARTLRREGYRVTEARDADEALALVSGDPSLADMLVTDVVMPGLSGVELASCIVAARPDVRVLFSSGASAMDTADTVRLPRGAAFLPKPFTPKALGDRVRSLFGL